MSCVLQVIEFPIYTGVFLHYCTAKCTIYTLVMLSWWSCVKKARPTLMNIVSEKRIYLRLTPMKIVCAL